MLNTDYKDEVLTVYLSGELDHNRAAGLRTKIDGRVNALSKVSFMDSLGIGLIMGRYRSVGLIGGKLRVVNIPDNLSKIIALSGISSLGVLR